MAMALFLGPVVGSQASCATTVACETFHPMRPTLTRPPGGVTSDRVVTPEGGIDSAGT